MHHSRDRARWSRFYTVVDVRLRLGSVRLSRSMTRDRGSRERRESPMRYMSGSFGRIATVSRRWARGIGAAIALAIVLSLGVAAGAEADGSLNGRISFTSFRDGGLG